MRRIYLSQVVSNLTELVVIQLANSEQVLSLVFSKLVKSYVNSVSKDSMSASALYVLRIRRYICPKLVSFMYFLLN